MSGPSEQVLQRDVARKQFERHTKVMSQHAEAQPRVVPLKARYRRWLRAAALVLLVTSLWFSIDAVGQTPWVLLDPGLEFGRIRVHEPTPVGDSTITVVRVDPTRWNLRILSSRHSGHNSRTAREWAVTRGLVAVTNGGMFAADGQAHVGYLRSDGQTYSGHVNRYRSLAVFEPSDSALVAFQVVDLDEVAFEDAVRGYRSAVQNLRLIKRPGENRWSPQDKKWSEAALAEDDKGRILFVFSRSPYTMRDFNRILLTLPLGIVAAQHLEGGPEAQLFVRYGDFEYEGFGSYETGFYESDANASAWPVPNVLAIVPRPERP